MLKKNNPKLVVGIFCDIIIIFHFLEQNNETRSDGCWWFWILHRWRFGGTHCKWRWKIEQAYIYGDSDQVAIKLAVNLKLFCNNDL